MPWTGPSITKHNKALAGKPAMASKAAGQANAVLANTGNEGMAIAVANKGVKSAAKSTSRPATKTISKPAKAMPSLAKGKKK